MKILTIFFLMIFIFTSCGKKSEPQYQGKIDQEAERFRWSKRVLELDQSPDGTIWVLEDGADGRLIQFTRP